ncbi:MAG: tetratricopeptide repeat protein [Candidatus Eremiobacteraeota bacterium]|nr:tetratricopeptide repeat protein [Candidatus Eremiobacteraeota bacterium]
MEQQDRVEELRTAAAAALFNADYRTMERLARELVEYAQATRSKRGLALGYHFIGNGRLQNGDGESAEIAYHKSLKLYEELGDAGAAAQVMMNLGIVAVEINLDVREARRLYDQALPIVRSLDDERRLALALGNFGEILRLEGDYDKALSLGRESYNLFIKSDSVLLASGQLVNIAHYHSLRREYAIAMETLNQAYEVINREQNPHWLAGYFDVWFIIATELNAAKVAALLLGFVDHFRDQKKVPRLQGMLPWASTCMDRLRKRLTDQRFAELRADGAKLTPVEAQALVDSIGDAQR